MIFWRIKRHIAASRVVTNEPNCYTTECGVIPPGTLVSALYHQPDSTNISFSVDGYVWMARADAHEVVEGDREEHSHPRDHHSPDTARRTR